MMKTAALPTLLINKWAVAILLGVCLIAVMLNLLFWKIELTQLLLTYGTIILINSSDITPVMKNSIPPRQTSVK